MKKRTSYILLIAMSAYWYCGVVYGQTISKNLSLADFIDYETLYGGQSLQPDDPDSRHITLADVASWQNPADGKEYALVGLITDGSGSGVAMVDVTDPGNIEHHKTIRISEEIGWNTPHDVKVHGNRAYIAQDDNGFVKAYWVNLQTAVNNRDNSTAGTYQTGLDSLSNEVRIHNMFINPDHELLFMSDFRRHDLDFDQSQYNIGPPIQVFDISGSSPSYRGEIELHVTNHLPVGHSHLLRSHDLYAHTTGSSTGIIFDASMVAMTVYEYQWDESTFSIENKYFHRFNPLRGHHPSTFNQDIPNKQIHSTWIGNNPDYLFVTIEGPSGCIAGAPGCTNLATRGVDPATLGYQRGNYLSVWDVSNLDASPDSDGYRYPIKQVYEIRENQSDGNFESSNFPELTGGEVPNSIHNVLTRGNEAYISYYTKGIRVLDVTDPTNMSEIAYYDVPGLPEYFAPVYNGAWGVDPFLPSGTVLGSSSEGLYVFYKPYHFAGTVEVPTRWSNKITLVGDLDVQENISMEGGSVTIEASTTATITASSGKVTIGEFQGVSSKRLGDSGDAIVDIIPASDQKEQALVYRLDANYPNPFNPITTIAYELPQESKVSLVVYDIMGRRVTTLVSSTMPAGSHTARFDASQLASGVYIYRLTAGDFVQTRQMMLVK